MAEETQACALDCALRTHEQHCLDLLDPEWAEARAFHCVLHAICGMAITLIFLLRCEVESHVNLVGPVMEWP